MPGSTQDHPTLPGTLPPSLLQSGPHYLCRLSFPCSHAAWSDSDFYLDWPYCPCRLPSPCSHTAWCSFGLELAASHWFLLIWSLQTPLPALAPLDGTPALKKGGDFIYKQSYAERLRLRCRGTGISKLLCVCVGGGGDQNSSSEYTLWLFFNLRSP